ncbi:hypothetical protein, partial [Arthrobacter caoxuetaonis]
WDLTFVNWSGVTNTQSHGGSNSAYTRQSGSKFTQTVTVPAETPILTYWAGSGTVVQAGNTAMTSVKTGRAEGIWTQYKADFSAYAGKTIQLVINNPAVVSTYFDDLAFVAKE